MNHLCMMCRKNPVEPPKDFCDACLAPFEPKQSRHTPKPEPKLPDAPPELIEWVKNNPVLAARNLVKWRMVHEHLEVTKEDLVVELHRAYAHIGEMTKAMRAAGLEPETYEPPDEIVDNMLN